MQSDQRDVYREFAAQINDLPLFMQPWYLDTVCEGGAWNAVCVEKGGKPVAVLPYFLKRKLFWEYVTMPHLCKQLGPYLAPEYRTLNHEMRLYEQLIAGLPGSLAAFEQNFNYTVQNWLPFYWNGFKQNTMYSYILSLAPEEAALFQNIEKNYRQKIKSASQLLTLAHDLPVSVLHKLVNLSFERQGKKSPISLAFISAVHKTLDAQQKCRMFFALDSASGQVHSAGLLAWDAHTAYYLLSGDDPGLRQSGAAVWLKWEAILFARNRLGLSVFDFEGSMIRGVEQGRRDFGAVQKPYFRIRKENSPIWKWKNCLR